ncbi:MAG: hypothetical protein RL095_1141 [Verrucomicrobiota bacterium]|jgi:pimeloyl-ACP methyl ester carboxylesterase
MPLVTCAGIKLNYEERGRGRPLVLIMGLSAPGAVWEEHVKAYEKHFRCILVDNRGAGDSDKPEGPYSTAMMADDVAALITELKLGPCAVAGISMGGAIAQELALRHPHLVRSLVIISSWAKCDAYAAGVFRHFQTMRRVASPHDFMQLLQLWIFAAPFYAVEANRQALAEGCDKAHEGYMPRHAFLAQAEACIAHDAVSRLPQIRVPTLITVGDLDIFTPLKFSEELHRLIPGSELVVLPGTGHAHHWESLELFNQKTTDFLLKH